MGAPLFELRICFCIALFILSAIAFNSGKQLAGLIIMLVALTSTWYHTTESPVAEQLDMTTILLTAPACIYLVIQSGNLIAPIAGAIAAATFAANREALSWTTHFFGVDLPGLVAYGSLVL
jgi:MFS superfamily sulfate permease-like transporter